MAEIQGFMQSSCIPVLRLDLEKISECAYNIKNSAERVLRLLIEKLKIICHRAEQAFAVYR